jgi:hypothetical protein
MKKIFLPILIFISSVQVYHVDAIPVSAETAMKAAKNFMNGKINSSQDFQIIYKSISQVAGIPGTAVNINYYILGSANSFVIIAGDDIINPVLGYSTESGFNSGNIPENVSQYLDNYSTVIESLVSNNNTSSPVILAKWNSLLNNAGNTSHSKSSSGVSPLIKTKWNQGAYYNDLCPVVNTIYNAYTGCVATVMAQLMKYWKYPASGIGFHSYTDGTNGVLSASFGNTVYSWDSMPASVNNTNHAVAQLMFQCGVAVNMNYGKTYLASSTAYVLSSNSPVSNCTEYALKTYFGYKSSIKGVKARDYSSTNWENLIRNELDHARPVIYDGYGPIGGHSFICDGHDTSNYFHMNWGWSGQYDGYFALSLLTPGSDDFTSYQEALIGIEPVSSATVYNIQLHDFVIVSPNPVFYKQGFSINTNLINSDTRNFKGDVCALIFDKSYSLFDTVGVARNLTLNAGDTFASSLQFTSVGSASLVPGTYYIELFYRTTGGIWMQVEPNGKYLNFSVLPVSSFNSIVLYSRMNVLTGLYNGRQAVVSLNVANEGGDEFDGDFDVSLYNGDGSQALSLHQITNQTLIAGTHFSNDLIFIDSSLVLKPGTYYLGIKDKRTGKTYEYLGTKYYPSSVKVTVYPPPLNPDKFEANNTADSSFTLPLVFSGDTANVNTDGSNIHNADDVDYYKIVADYGYDYVIRPILEDYYWDPNLKHYTLTAFFAYSTDGINWSANLDDWTHKDIILKGGATVYFRVIATISSSTGTYRLNIGMKRTKNAGISSESSNNHHIRIWQKATSLVVDCTQSDCNPSQWMITSLQGKIILSGTFSNTGNNIKTLPLNYMMNGLYLFQIQTNTGRINEKFLVVN